MATDLFSLKQMECCNEHCRNCNPTLLLSVNRLWEHAEIGDHWKALKHGTTLFGGKLAHEYLIRFWISENQTQLAVARKSFQTTTEINRSFLKSPCQFSPIFLAMSVSWDVLMYTIDKRWTVETLGGKILANVKTKINKILYTLLCRQTNLKLIPR